MDSKNHSDSDSDSDSDSSLLKTSAYLAQTQTQTQSNSYTVVTYLLILTNTSSNYQPEGESQHIPPKSFPSCLGRSVESSPVEAPSFTAHIVLGVTVFTR
jgi:hypothetical protein